MTHCARCDNGERRAATRARVAERNGRTAVVLGVPVEVCEAKRLDTMLNDMLALDVEVATRHYDAKPDAA